jgi:bifunctional DNA-binding transcriptional regulator/antitoxin component of YhaV-PrlF toxin-antitoxin module
MTTTISVTTEGQLVLPKAMCQRKKIKPGTALRVTEVGQGLYVTPVPEPSEKELKQVIAAAGSLTHEPTAEDEDMVQRVIEEYRVEKRSRKR